MRQRRQLPSLTWCAHRLLYIGVVGCYCSGSVIPTQYLPSSSFSIQRALQFRMLKPTQHNSSCRTHLYTYCNQYAFTVTHSPQRGHCYTLSQAIPRNAQEHMHFRMNKICLLYFSNLATALHCVASLQAA